MINKIYQRTIQLIGEEKFQKLQNSSILLAGVGGVGSYVAEALVRGGIGNLTIVDKDFIEISNINRQLHALKSTLGLSKVEVMSKRLLEINPNLKILAIQKTVNKSFLDQILKESKFDYIVDAIDDVFAKVDLAICAKEYQIPIILSMGTANKLDNQSFIISDISKTKVCPLARKMRYELKKYNIYKDLKVLYSEAKPEKIDGFLGTISFVPGTAGLLLAGEVIRDIIKSV